MSFPSPTDSPRPAIPPWLILAALTAAATAVVQCGSLINSDVAILSWVARETMGPKVFGLDVMDISPPLCVLIYMPAALLAPALTFPLAIKLWVGAISCLSVAVFWHCCDERLQLPLTAALVIIIVLMFPSQFGQREQIALFLTAPYVAGPSRSRGWAIASGIMAGIGFALKPYFLFALVLVFATRRRIGREELAIMAVGAAYAAVLLVFFQPYLVHFLPLALPNYGALHLEQSDTLIFAGIILALLAVPAFGGEPQAAELGFLMATIGFTAGALLQMKGFAYHFSAAWGFLGLYLTARCFNRRRIVRWVSAAYLLILGCTAGWVTLGWFTTPDPLMARMQQLLPTIDAEASFQTFVPDMFPASPTMIYTRSAFTGVFAMPFYLSAAYDRTASPESRRSATILDAAQAVLELSRRPALVIVKTPAPVGGRDPMPFSYIAWLQRDQAFRTLWQDYAFEKTVDGFDLYRRK